MTVTDTAARRGTPSEIDAPSLGLRLRITSLLEGELDACRIEGHRQVEKLVGKGDKLPNDHPLRASLLERAISRSVVARATVVLAPDGSSAPFASSSEALGAWPPHVVDMLVRVYEEHLEREAGALRPDPALASQTVDAILAADEGAESLAGAYDARGCAIIARAMGNELRALLASSTPLDDLEALRRRIEEARAPITIDASEGIPSAEEQSA